MTDEQIEKGLECCSTFNEKHGYPEDCKNCSYNGSDMCCPNLIADALAYINRLKAEKAVSDRALELAVNDYGGMVFFYQAVSIDDQTKLEEYKNKAKQELEKEKTK